MSFVVLKQQNSYHSVSYAYLIHYFPDKIPAPNAMQPSWKKGPDAGYFMMKGQPSSFQAADGFEDFNLERKDGSVSLLTGLDSKQSNRRSVKVPRGNTGGSKRSRIVQMEVSVNESSVEDIKSSSTGNEMYAAKGVVAGIYFLFFR